MNPVQATTSRFKPSVRAEKLLRHQSDKKTGLFMEESQGGVGLQKGIWVISFSCFIFSLLQNNYSVSLVQQQQQQQQQDICNLYQITHLVSPIQYK